MKKGLLSGTYTHNVGEYPLLGRQAMITDFIEGAPNYKWVSVEFLSARGEKVIVHLDTVAGFHSPVRRYSIYVDEKLIVLHCPPSSYSSYPNEFSSNGFLSLIEEFTQDDHGNLQLITSIPVAAKGSPYNPSYAINVDGREHILCYGPEGDVPLVGGLLGIDIANIPVSHDRFSTSMNGVFFDDVN